ncbi:unnamed protein product, partial [Allacma fusca]
MEISKRRDWVKEAKRCFNCLGSHHANTCVSTKTCSVCQKKHHTSLHRPESEGFRRSPSVNTILHQTTDKVAAETGLLPTALVAVEHKGFSMVVRSLLDTGAQNSFITEAIVNRLKLPLRQGPEIFSVAGGHNLPVLGQVTIWIRSLVYPDKALMIEPYVLTQITADLPTHPIEVQQWDHTAKLPLADPNFNTPGPIDLLLGSSIIDRIMRAKRIKGRHFLPSAYSTDFGYIIMGAVPAPTQQRV